MKKVIGLLLVTVAPSAISAPAMAQTVCAVTTTAGGTKAQGTAVTSADVACGGKADSTPLPNRSITGPIFKGATAIGSASNAQDNATAIGAAADAQGNGSVALGDGTSALGISSTSSPTELPTVAIGGGSTASYGGIAIGGNITAEAGDVMIGLRTRKDVAPGSFNSVIIGTDAQVANGGSPYLSVEEGFGPQVPNAIAIGTSATAGGTGSIAIGGYNAWSMGPYGTALGAAAYTMQRGDVALGAYSSTEKTHTGTTALFGGTAAGAATLGVVAVGNSMGAGPLLEDGRPNTLNQGQRQIQFVAPGVISASSTDAVNGSQLNSVGQGVISLGNETATALGGGALYSQNTGVLSGPTYHVAGGTHTTSWRG